MGGFIYGLAVALLIFEGIIIQCEGGGGGEGARIAETSESPSSSNQGEDVPIRDSKEIYLPTDLVKKIFYRINNEGRVEIFNNLPKERTPPEDLMPAHLMNVLLRNCIIVIQTQFFDENDSELKPEEQFVSYEESSNRDVKLIFRNYQRLVLFLEYYGIHVRKIHIEMSAASKLICIPHDIKNYAINLEELRIISSIDEDNAYGNHSKFWETISNIEFQNVTNVKIVDIIEQKDFKLHRMFPDLEYLSLHDIVCDENCLDNVTKLKELSAGDRSIREYKLDSIFKENKGLTKIKLVHIEMRKTLESIVEHLKNLKSLEIFCPERSFLFREGNDPLCKLPKLENFIITFPYMREVYEIEELGLEMPKLQELTMYGKFKVINLVKFLKHFNELKTVRLGPIDDALLKPMEQKWTLLPSKYTDGSQFRTFFQFSKK